MIPNPRWDRFYEFLQEVQAVCEKYNAAILHKPDAILVKMTEGEEVYGAGEVLGITPHRMICRPWKGRADEHGQGISI